MESTRPVRQGRHRAPPSSRGASDVGHGGKTELERFPGMPLCFIDRYGNKYTTAVATSDGDWWLRARILMLRDF